MKLHAFLAGAFLFVPLAAGQSALPLTAPGRIGPDPASSFVGSQTCRSCHASAHSGWSNGRHSRMLQEALNAQGLPAQRFHQEWFEMR